MPSNLLLISIEDLNDWIEPLGGHAETCTPNMRRLADMGASFTQAYTPAPACSPARTAALFSRFPWETAVYSNQDRWHDHFEQGSDASLIGHLRKVGMKTFGCGKIFHSSYRDNEETLSLDANDWDEFFFAPKVEYPPLSRSVKSGRIGQNADFGVDETGLPSYDDHNTDWIINKIEPGMEKCVWALGIYRPHLPFIVPKAYFDLIPEDVSLPPGLGANAFDPDNKRLIRKLPSAARRLAKKQARTGRILHEFGEYNEFLRAYLASIAYADSKLGMVLDRIEECGLLDDTLIVLWSDHGWQLGEKLAFRKFTLWERALRVPLIFAGAGIKPRRLAQPASLVDLAPTVLSLLDCAPNERYSGQDLSPAIENGSALSRDYAPSSWGIGFIDAESAKLAFSVRSERYRMTKYWDGRYELYDHDNDPFEHDNCAKKEFSPMDASKPPEIRRLGEVLDAIANGAAEPAVRPPRLGMQGDDDDQDTEEPEALPDD